MRLLVSVRSPDEIPAALAGGADIVDAKEPSRGSLGAVSVRTLREISRCLPSEVPLSVALGDPGSVADVVEAIEGVDAALPPYGELYLKIGLAGTRDPGAAESLLSAAVAAAARSASRPSVIAVAYADHASAGSPARDAVRRLAVRAGVSGVLLDTHRKNAGDLFAHVGEIELREWAGGARDSGLLVALAGSLTAAGVSRAAMLPADIVGVRGAACLGGREGRIDAGRVQAVRSALAREACST